MFISQSHKVGGPIINTDDIGRRWATPILTQQEMNTLALSKTPKSKTNNLIIKLNTVGLPFTCPSLIPTYTYKFTYWGRGGTSHEQLSVTVPPVGRPGSGLFRGYRFSLYLLAQALQFTENM